MRLIDADDFVESLQKGMSVLEEEQTKYDDMRKEIIGMSISYIGATINSVAEMPTVDAVPVVHGEWLSEWEGLEITVRCSVCGEMALIKEGGSHDHAYSHYCPNCGARMRGEHDEQ